MTLRQSAADLTDGVVRLRRRREADVGCIEEAATDPRIPAGTTVPDRFTLAAGLEFIRYPDRRADAVVFSRVASDGSTLDPRVR